MKCEFCGGDTRLKKSKAPALAKWKALYCKKYGGGSVH